MNKKLILIIVLAFLVRFIGLSSLPPALNRDEAAIGWNAYSILKTARDEHGQTMPLAFKSIGDYKMPLYIYATSLPVKFFGLNDFSIRFWSILAGIASVIAVYFLSKKLYPSNHTFALSAAFLMALNPWAVFYSRIGFEANLALAFFLSGFALVLQKHKTNWRFNLGLALFLLAFLTYSSSLIFIPLFLLTYFFFNRKSLTKSQLISLVIFALLFGFIFKSLWSISSQKANVTVFSDPTIINSYNQTRTEIFQTNPILARTWYNKYVYFSRLVATNYIKSFSPKFLLTVGGHHPWHRVPNIGNFYYLEIFLAVIGLYALVFDKNSRLKTILLPWLFLAPLASAITIDAPHSTRSLHLLPVILILSAFGFQSINQKGQVLRTRPFWKKLVVGVYLLNLSFFGYQYIKVYPQKFPSSIPLGLKEIFLKTPLEGQLYLYGIHDSNYLYPLIYQQKDPKLFQEQAVWTAPDLTNLTNVFIFNKLTLVDQIEDIKNPDYVIWPKQTPLNLDNLTLIQTSGHFNLYQAD